MSDVLTPAARANQRAKIRALWADPEWRAKQLARMHSPEARAKTSAAWRDPKKRARWLKSLNQPHIIAEHREIMAALWRDPRFAAMQRNMRAIEWTLPMIRALDAMRRQYHPSINVLARKLGICPQCVQKKCEELGIAWRVRAPNGSPEARTHGRGKRRAAA